MDSLIVAALFCGLLSLIHAGSLSRAILHSYDDDDHPGWCFFHGAIVLMAIVVTISCVVEIVSISSQH